MKPEPVRLTDEALERIIEDGWRCTASTARALAVEVRDSRRRIAELERDEAIARAGWRRW